MTYQSHVSLGRQIGNGHFGVVHEGVDDIHGPVAIKIPRQHPHETDVAWQARRAELLSEGQFLSRAKHSNVVHVHKLVKHKVSDDLLLVMEFCAGGSLQKPYEIGPMSSSLVHRYATDIVLGLSALHERGMIHRDIKPGNILVDAAGRAKLGDFGLVTDAIILGYADRAGYRDHLAPEVTLTGQTSTRTDVWALGMTLYRLLHGHPWYTASPMPRVLIPAGGFANTLSWLPHVSSRWRRLIRSMLNDESSSRPTIVQIQNALAGIADDMDWDCSGGANVCNWQTNRAGRRIDVKCERKGTKFEWVATSSPSVGAGRTRRLGASSQLSNWTTTLRELRAFFDRMRGSR